MTTERTHRVSVAPELADKLALLTRQYSDAQHRLGRGLPGDRSEVVRAEQLATQIETAAYESLLRPSPATGVDTVTIVWPFTEGVTPLPSETGAAAPPAAAWGSKSAGASRTDATFERFEEQLIEWAEGGPDAAGRKPLNPSQIQNRALTEALRAYARTEEGTTHGRVEAPVTYQDGSSALPFPLRCVPMSDAEPDDGRETMRMTLLSVRHVEMDLKVDGAWLRNREISLPRAAGLTDQIAYEQSLRQFEIISELGPVTLHLYQTGLAPANVGFYRALIHHNLQPAANPVAVVPYYFAGGDSYAPSDAPWTIR